MTQVWAGGAGRRWEGRSKAERDPLTRLPEAFLVWAPKAGNPRKPLRLATTRMIGHSIVSTLPNLLVMGAQCALSTGVPGDLPKVAGQRGDLNPGPLTPSSGFAPCLCS